MASKNSRSPNLADVHDVMLGIQGIKSVVTGRGAPRGLSRLVCGHGFTPVQREFSIFLSVTVRLVLKAVMT